MQEKDSLWSITGSGCLHHYGNNGGSGQYYSPRWRWPKRTFFGVQMFTGKKLRMSRWARFNPNYQIAIGDKITIRIWGAFHMRASFPWIPQGNIFIPQVGRLTSSEQETTMNIVVEKNVQKVFKNNIGVYASLDGCRVRYLWPALWRARGLYGGISSKFCLYFIDKASGVDPGRGSFYRCHCAEGWEYPKKINLLFSSQGSLTLCSCRRRRDYCDESTR